MEKQVNKKEANDTRNRAIEALRKEFGDELYVTVESGSFGMGSCTFRFNFSEVSESGVPENFATAAKILGLNPSIHGRRFICKGRQYIVESISLNRPKYPVLATRAADGANVKFTKAAIERLVPTD